MHNELDHLDELEAGKYFMLSSSVASGRPMSSSNLAMHTSHHVEQRPQCLMVSSTGVRAHTSNTQACGNQHD